MCCPLYMAVSILIFKPKVSIRKMTQKTSVTDFGGLKKHHFNLRPYLRYSHQNLNYKHPI